MIVAVGLSTANASVATLPAPGLIMLVFRPSRQLLGLVGRITGREYAW